MHWPILILPTYFGVEMTVGSNVVAVLASLIVAALMYRFVEQPFLRWKDRLERPPEEPNPAAAGLPA